MVGVGVYLDLRNPPPWRVEPSKLFGFALEMCEEADRLGVDSIWLSEHHLFDDDYLPQPLTFAAAVAARTRNARIGTAVLLAPLRHPVHVAEEAAIVDLISNGRLDLGLGAGYRPPEFDLFGVDFTARYRDTDAMVRRLRAIWADGSVTPAPVQECIPIWLGYKGPQGVRRVGRMGEGLLAVRPNLYPIYREGLIEGGHDPSTARMTDVVHAYATDDPEGDWPIIARHHAYQWDSYNRYLVEGTELDARPPVDAERAREHGLSFGWSDLLYGSPEYVAEQMKATFAGLPIKTFFFWLSIAGQPEEMVRRNLQTISTRLRPLLADWDGVS
jgi:alkanesulfonate monooxygenase SsuD/methylene tetrahydromethanopterin reductase-like flavin-dependent oxidoreductase (luciferase family)